MEAWKVALVSVCVAPIDLLTIVANLLVIISFKVEPKLQTVSNYFLLSLAVSDLIIGEYELLLSKSTCIKI